MENQEKIKKKLTLYKAELEKYKKYFLEDGIIDSDEQKQLDAMLATIKKAEEKLNGGTSSFEIKTKEDFNKVLDEMEAIVKRKQEFLITWDDRFSNDVSNIA